MINKLKPLRVMVVPFKKMWHRASHPSQIKSGWCFLLLIILSSTRLLIERLTANTNGDKRAHILMSWSWGCFAVDALLTLLLLAFDQSYFSLNILGWLFAVLAFWRINEIVFAFIQDSLDVVQKIPSKSSLSSVDRIYMLARSAFGLIFWFAFLYAFIASINNCAFKDSAITSFREAFYFSALTLLGMGQEGLEVKDWSARFFHVYEGLSGVVLLVFALTVYLGKEQKTPSN